MQPTKKSQKGRSVDMRGLCCSVSVTHGLSAVSVIILDKILLPLWKLHFVSLHHWMVKEYQKSYPSDILYEPFLLKKINKVSCPTLLYCAFNQTSSPGLNKICLVMNGMHGPNPKLNDYRSDKIEASADRAGDIAVKTVPYVTSLAIMNVDTLTF